MADALGDPRIGVAEIRPRRLGDPRLGYPRLAAATYARTPGRCPYSSTPAP
jgi:hypothetical protein